MLEKFLVVEKDAETVAYSEQVGVVFSQLMDTLYLFFKEILFEVVAQVWIVVIGSHTVQI